MKKPKAVQASAAETTAQRLGAEQSAVASGMKNRLIGAVNKSAMRNDSAILRSSASAATAQATGNALATAVDPMQRAAAVVGGNNATAKAKSDANTTARGSMVDRISGAIQLGFGAQEGSANSITRLAQAQNNAAFTIADAKMRNTAATMNALGNAATAYMGAREQVKIDNALNRQQAIDAGMSYYDHKKSPFSRKLISMPTHPIGG